MAEKKKAAQQFPPEPAVEKAVAAPEPVDKDKAARVFVDKVRTACREVTMPQHLAETILRLAEEFKA